MHSDSRPTNLELVCTLTIDSAPIDDPIDKLQAIAFADFKDIHQRLIRGYPLDDKQVIAVKRFRRDKSGRLVDLALKDKVRAIGLLSKAMGWSSNL